MTKCEICEERDATMRISVCDGCHNDVILAAKGGHEEIKEDKGGKEMGGEFNDEDLADFDEESDVEDPDEPDIDIIDDE